MKKVLRFLFPFNNKYFNLIFWLLLAAVVSVYMYHPDFIFGDDMLQVRSICRGKFRSLGIVPSYGRFMPLQGLDVNFVLLLPLALRTNIPLLLYVWISILFVLTSLLFASILRVAVSNDEKCFRSDLWMILYFCVFLTNQSTVIALFVNSCMPEGRMMLGLGAFMICAFKLLASKSHVYGILMIVSAIYTSCFKENAFLLPATFGFVVLIFGWRNFDRWTRWAFTSLLIWPLIYLGTYLIWIYPKVSFRYSEGHAVSLMRSAKVFLGNSVSILIVTVAIWRSGMLLLKHSRKNLFWDALAIASVAHIASYIALRYSVSYYIAPSCMFAVPVLCYWTVRLLSNFTQYIWVPVTIAFSVIIGWQELPKSCATLKSIIYNKSSDVPQLRTLIAAKPTKIYYLRQRPSLFVDYGQVVFKHFCAYVSITNAPEISSCKEIPVLASNEVLVISRNDTDFGNVCNGLRKHCGVEPIFSSMFAWAWGPIDVRAKEIANNEVIISSNDAFSCHDFYGCEPWGGRWGKGTSKIVLRVSEDVRGKPMDCVAQIGACVVKTRPIIPVTITIGDKIVKEVEIDSFASRSVPFTIPGNCTNVEVLEIAFSVPEPVIPSLVSDSKDNRELGVAFRELRIQPVAKE